jgi:hypothetical protein
MIVGIMSDSHGDVRATARAIDLLSAGGAAYFIHCGDVCGEAVLDCLTCRPATFVWGNCDLPTPQLRKYVLAVGLSWPDGPARLDLAGKRIGVYHGHERQFAESINGDFDYVFYGHTHEFADDRRGMIRLINPGALYRARPRTCALLNLATDELTFLDLRTGNPVQLPVAK